MRVKPVLPELGGAALRIKPVLPVRVAVDGVVRGTPPERAMAELRFPPQFSQLAVAVLAPGVLL